MKFENTKTKENLEKALQGEALAHLKYQFYTKKIREYSEELAQELEEITHNEKEHGKIWFKKLHNNDIPNDIPNLKDAITGEKHECSQMYPEFATTAEKEGFYEIATLFRKIGEIECEHWEKFEKMLKKIEKNTQYEEKTPVEWKCLNCGHIETGEKPPKTCPVCDHPQKYFTTKI